MKIKIHDAPKSERISQQSNRVLELKWQLISSSVGAMMIEIRFAIRSQLPRALFTPGSFSLGVNSHCGRLYRLLAYQIEEAASCDERFALGFAAGGSLFERFDLPPD